MGFNSASFKNKVPLLLLCALAGVLALVGCERIEPTPDASVLLQASGYYSNGVGADRAARLQIREVRSGSGTLVVEVASQGLRLASADTGVGTLAELFAGSDRGALRYQVEGSVFRVGQDCSLTRALIDPKLASVDKVATAASLEFSGKRVVQYNAGLLERGLDGQVHLVFKSADGTVAASFDGMTSLPGPGREGFHGRGPVAVATAVSGQVVGSFWYGGGLFGQGGHEATLALALPNGAGKVIVGAHQQRFTFNKDTDITPPGGTGSMQVTDSSDTHITLNDVFQAQISVPSVDLEEDDWMTSVHLRPKTKQGSGQGNLHYAVTLTVDPHSVQAVASVQLDAYFHTTDGDHLKFLGQNPHLDTQLDW